MGCNVYFVSSWCILGSAKSSTTTIHQIDIHHSILIKISHQKMIEKYLNMSYNTVKIELECFQTHSFRIYLLMNNVTYMYEY